MGAGKTSVGKRLARRLGCSFVDLDDLIEEKEKRAITDIFAKDGEEYFRAVETAVLKDTAKKQGIVAACGGGIVIVPENIAVMKATGTLICLTATADIILARTSKHRYRPLLNVSDPRKKIEELLHKRAPFYAKADYVIDTSLFSVQAAAEKIEALIAIEKK